MLMGRRQTVERGSCRTSSGTYYAEAFEFAPSSSVGSEEAISGLIQCMEENAIQYAAWSVNLLFPDEDCAILNSNHGALISDIFKEHDETKRPISYRCVAFDPGWHSS